MIQLHAVYKFVQTFTDALMTRKKMKLSFCLIFKNLCQLPYLEKYIFWNAGQYLLLLLLN